MPQSGNRLFVENTHLAGILASRYSQRLPSNIEWDDLHNAALLGLWQASESFDCDRGIPFTSYAKRRMTGAMLDEVRVQTGQRGVVVKAHTSDGSSDKKILRLKIVG